jgi:hypothetical protein
MKYRKKPVVIEAFQYYGDLIPGNDPDWAMKAFEQKIIGFASKHPEKPPCDMYIDTLEGRMLVNVGDYVIKGVNGELYACKPDIFKKTYEKDKDIPNPMYACCKFKKIKANK